MNTCQTEQITFHGWEAFQLSNGLVRLVCVPALGGRVMAYQLGPYDYLYRNPALLGQLYTPEENQGDGSLAAWKNYGGDKTWVAPQGWDNDDQWHGPPDGVLDTGRYTVTHSSQGPGQASLTMESPATSPTGVQISRTVSLSPVSSRIRLNQAFKNVSDRPRRWSIWDIVQLEAGQIGPAGKPVHNADCRFSAPLNPHSRHAAGYHILYGAADNPQWRADAERGLFIGQYLYELGKVGLDSMAGWAAFADAAKGCVFTMRFPTYPEAEYPDNGSTVEFWTVGAGQVGNLDFGKEPMYYVECEVLSPLYMIEPGESASFTVEWGAAVCPGLVMDVTPGGAIHTPIKALIEGEYARLHGCLGVFDQGTLMLEWRTGDGAALESQPLGEVGPLGAVTLDHLVPMPSAAAQLHLSVQSGAQRLPIAQITMPG